jgi:DNA (cytosine-5)-methyltransferase 1
MRVVWQCEQNDYCRRVLARHWPGVPCYPDVRALVADSGRGGVQHRAVGGGVPQPQGAPAGEAQQRQRGGHALGDGGSPRAGLGDEGGAALPVPVPYVDVLCGGFPCQPTSGAGLGLGALDERWLWPEFARVIRELRPRWVVIENVPGLLVGRVLDDGSGRPFLWNGMGEVLGDLAAMGYDAEWSCVSAGDVGAPHLRERIWIVAYPDARRLEECAERNGGSEQSRLEASQRHDADRLHTAVADTDGTRRANVEGRSGSRAGRWPVIGSDDAGRWPHDWIAEPDVGRVAHGIPARVDRLAALGNALVPQIAECIGRRIVEWETASGRLATLPD